MSGTFTKGVKNALARGNPHSICKGCGFPLPRYPGRYPKNCPSCDAPRERPAAESAKLLRPSVKERAQ